MRAVDPDARHACGLARADGGPDYVDHNFRFSTLMGAVNRLRVVTTILSQTTILPFSSNAWQIASPVSVSMALIKRCRRSAPSASNSWSEWLQLITVES